MKAHTPFILVIVILGI